VTSYTEGFSHFVTSMTAPVASGWSGRRVGLAPTAKRRLLTAHASSGHCKSLCCTSSWEKPAAHCVRSVPMGQNARYIALVDLLVEGRPFADPSALAGPDRLAMIMKNGKMHRDPRGRRRFRTTCRPIGV
jgi:hypothetical protein